MSAIKPSDPRPRPSPIPADDDPVKLCNVKIFLESYQVASQMLRITRLEANSLAADRAAGLIYYRTVGGDQAHWLAVLRDVRDFIESLENGNAKVLLYYHYIRGNTVEQIAEVMDISLRNAFRQKKRALSLAAVEYEKWQAARQAEKRTEKAPPSSFA